MESQRERPIQMSVERYLEIRDAIVSRSEGCEREKITSKYIVVDNQFVSKNKAPLGIVSKDPSEEPQEYLNWLATNSGFIQGLTSTFGDKGQKPITLSDIQSFLVDSTHKFLWIVKARQFGLSYSMAARALALSMLKRKHTDIFVSYNEEESKEKITYARELYDSIPTKYKLGRKLKYDNKTSLVFEKSGPESSETRILSFPQRIIRGKGGDVHVKLDEASYCLHLKKIYTSAMPVLSRGDSSIWVGGTPAGKGGLYYDIGTNDNDNYSLYVRVRINWWDVPEFCLNVKEARAKAADMVTEERVMRYGTEMLKMIFKGMIIEEFQQEYECLFIDESYAYYPLDLIMGCVLISNVEAENDIDYDVDAQELSESDKLKSGKGIEFYTDFELFVKRVHEGAFPGSILGGYDVGRTTDASEIVFLEETKDHNQIVRCNVQLKNMPLPEQRDVVKGMMESLGSRLIKFGVDDAGLGRNIAEDLELISYDIVSRCRFNDNNWKEEVAKRMKYRMQLGKLTLPSYKQLISQTHSIKRILLPGGTWRFDTLKNEKHHGDKFWAMIAASEQGHPVIDSDNKNVYDLDKRIGEKTVKTPKNKQIVNVFQIDNKFDPYHNMKHSLSHIPMPTFRGVRLPDSLLSRFGNSPIKSNDVFNH